MENQKETKLKMNLLFLSIPLSGLAALFRYHDFYKALEFVLLLFIVSIMTILYLYISGEQRKSYSPSLLSTTGFLIITTSSVIADYRHINLIFLFGVSILAIYSELNFSLLSILSYTFLMTLLGIGTKEYTVLSLLTAIFIIILSKFYSDIMSLIYVILTILSLNIVGTLILNNLFLSSLSEKDRFIDVGIIIIVNCFSYFLYLDKKKIQVDETILPIQEVSLKEENQKIQENIEEKAEIQEETPHKIDILSIPDEPNYDELMSEKTFLYVLIKSNQALFDSSTKRAKLCSEIAEMIGANGKLAAAGAFYADCGKLNTDNYIKESLHLIKQYNLPSSLLKIVKEHHFKFGYPSSKEAAIVMILFKLESSIAFFQLKKKKFPASHVINNVTDSLLMAGKFDKSGLGIHDYKFIKDYLTEEVPKEYDYFN